MNSRKTAPASAYGLFPSGWQRRKGALMLISHLLFYAVAIHIFCTPQRSGTGAAHPPMRIISLAPSVTETLFALGLGARLVGVTAYCTYPPGTKTIEKIGGYTDANLERIVALKPDLVILSADHKKQRSYLERFGIPLLVVEQTTCAAVCSSFRQIGRICGVNAAADSLTELFRVRLQKRPYRAGAVPRVLLCVGHDTPGGGTIRSVYAASRSTFYNDLIEAAGGENAFRDSLPQYPKLSFEGIIALAPDVIIDIASAMGDYECSRLELDWRKMDRLEAVRKGRVCCISADYAAIPGPRLLLLLEDIKEVLSSFFSEDIHG